MIVRQNDIERLKRNDNARHARLQRSRYARRQRNRGRSNVRFAVRPEGWAEWIAEKLRLRKRKRANALPVHLRFHVPHVRETMEKGGVKASQIWANLKDACTPSQYKSLRKQYAQWAGTDLVD